MSANNGKQNPFPVNAVQVGPGIRVVKDYYGGGGVFNPLDVGGGPEDDFVRRPRTSWPAAVVPEGGTPITFLRQDDYPFDPGAGAPKNTGRVVEGQTDLSVEADRAMRPTQLIEASILGQPKRVGEGPRYVARATEPLDPSVVSLDLVGKKRSKPMMVFDTFSASKLKTRWHPGVQSGMGQLGIEVDAGTPEVAAVPGFSLTSLLSTALVAPLAKQWSAILNKEAELQGLSPQTYAAATQPYAAARADMENRMSRMAADPSLVTSLGPTFTATALVYKKSLDSAVTKLKDALAKSAAAAKKTPSLLPALPKAVAQTIWSKYGAIVLGVGALVVGGLFVLRARQKKG